MNVSDFGRDFIWGVAGSAYQTEGAYLTDDKGLSIWDVFSKVKGNIKKNHNGQVACDFYNRYIQDLILLNYLGIPNFRLSISWPRIYPNGTGAVSYKGIEFYDRLIDFCLEMKIEPWVTLYHWDLPQELEKKGGWTNRNIIYWFEDYVKTCVQKFGDRVKNWMILNEPMVFTGAGYFLGIHAPGKKGLNNFLAAAHHAVLCQAHGGRVIRSLRKNANIGTTFSTSLIEPVDHSKLNKEAANKIDALTNRMFIEPLLGLGYPIAELKVLGQLEKFMKPNDETLMAFDMDFIGVQNYTRELVKYSSLMPYVNGRLVKASQREVPITTMDWEIYPQSIYEILKKFAAYKKVRNIIVTENGAAFNDHVSGGHVNDLQRVQFIKDYLEKVLLAKHEGVPVSGYFLWTFMDNFEWAEGYEQRFGIVYTDYTTQKRIIKSSGYWYQQFLANVLMEPSALLQTA